MQMQVFVTQQMQWVVKKHINVPVIKKRKDLKDILSKNPAK